MAEQEKEDLEMQRRETEMAKLRLDQSSEPNAGDIHRRNQDGKLADQGLGQ